MKAKVIATLLAIVICAAFLGTTPASAAAKWYTCTVEKVGPYGDKMFIWVNHAASPPAFLNKRVLFDEIWQNQMLAMSLTAVSIDYTIRIKIDPAIKDPKITQMLLNSY